MVPDEENLYEYLIKTGKVQDLYKTVKLEFETSSSFDKIQNEMQELVLQYLEANPLLLSSLENDKLKQDRITDIYKKKVVPKMFNNENKTGRALYGFIHNNEDKLEHQVDLWYKELDESYRAEKYKK